MTGGDCVLAVETLGVRGDGVAHRDGVPVYLPLTLPGDVVCARVGPRHGDGRRGEVLGFENQAPRAAPRCPHFGACGGCALQHVPEADYVAAKTSWLRIALRQHGLDDVAILPLRLLPPGTRRRARLAMTRPRAAQAPVAVGFLARASHRVVDLQDCAVLNPALAALVPPLRALGATVLAPGEAGAATMTLAESGIDLLLDLAAAPGIAGLEAMAAFARAHDLARLTWRAQGIAPVPVAQHRPVRMVFAGVAVDLPQEGFLQASAEADAALGDAVLAAAEGASIVADLFAGLGTFTFPLAKRAAVHAVEGEEAAVAALRMAARRAELEGRVSVERRDLAARPLAPHELARFDAVVFDPPRAGAWAQSKALAQSSVKRVVAVSCNPATFARDAAALAEGGYRLAWVQPVDSFIWSPHLELVARFERG